MNKQQELNRIAREIENCEVCKQDSIGLPVTGEGNPDAKIALIGEAPGKKEAECGRPFVGRSGQLLRTTLKEIGINPEDTFITSPVKYLPKRGTPSKKQITHGKVHFDKQMAVINPKIIVLLGKVAAFAVLEQDIPILRRHGEIIEFNIQSSKFKILITIHPAAVIRFKKYREIFISDLAMLRDF